MNHESLYNKVAVRCSKLTTNAYSTSFSLGIFCLEKKLRDPIYSIYGFVRFADEIVDTFHNHEKGALLKKFQQDTYEAIEQGISMNPILHSFQQTVNKYKINRTLIDQFLASMKMDLGLKEYDQSTFQEYILGSAEVVGLMCLKVFCQGDEKTYERLKPMAMKLGSAFQKINFLRDLNADFNGMGRSYFPGIDLERFDENDKVKIEADIAKDFHQGYLGIKELPRGARFGVYVAYLYYLALFKKIKNTPSEHVMKRRIRIKNRQKFRILFYSYLKHQLNLI